MFCVYCGKEIEDNTVYCPHCGGKQPGKEEIRQPNEGNNSANVGWGILSFFLPIVGLILFLCWRTQYPERAKVCGICALVGVCLDGALSGIFHLLSAIFSWQWAGLGWLFGWLF